MKQVIIAFTSIFLSSVCIAQNQKDLSQETASVNSVGKLEAYNKHLQNSQQQLVFQENKGQVSDQYYHPRPDVLFSGQSNGMVFHLKNKGISYQLNRVDSYKEVKDERKGEMRSEIDQSTIYRIDINWLNTNSATRVKKENAVAGFNNYYLEHCPEGALHVLSYENVFYENIYNGIDLKWYSNNGSLKYDYLVAAGADYQQIVFEIEGAESIVVNEKGELVIKTPLGTIVEESPYVIQEGKELTSQWVINNNRIHFNIENIDASKPFIIDPVVRQWGTYYGGTNNDQGYHCSLDESGNVYLAGETGTVSGTIIATSGSHQSTINGVKDAFLTKFNTSGVRQWGTYYGGSGDEVGYCSAIDAAGNIYFSGSTTTSTSTSIATIGSHQSSFGGGSHDAFLVKFNSSGVRQWGTYYGGSGEERAYSCSVDGIDNVYLTGRTTSPTTTNVATIGSHQSSNGGGSIDAFLVKFNSSGLRQWGTYYGGTDNDISNSCAVDNAGNIFIAGVTSSPTALSIATIGCHQNSYGGGTGDAFLAKFNTSGVRQWGTYYGGSGYDEYKSVATDASDNIYLTGYTNTPTGTNIATPGSHQSTHGGSYDAFLVKFNTTGVRQWGSYYGGDGYEVGRCTFVDNNGDVYMSGETPSTFVEVIATSGSYQSTIGGSYDAFLVKFNSAGLRFWGTYYGGALDEIGYGCAIDLSGNIYLAGSTTTPTTSSIIASPSGYQYTFGGGVDAFLAKFIDCTPTSGTATISSCTPITWINGVTYSSSNSIATHTLTNAAGCDSIVTLNFTRLFPSAGTATITSCTPITWIDGNTYSTSNSIATHTLTNAAGCDSIVTLNFTRLISNTGVATVNACNTYTWINGITYTSSTNTPTFTLTNAAGCDSVVTLNLTINSVSNLSTTLTGATISANNSSATYQWLDCNNSFAQIAGQTAQTFSPSFNGSYAVQLTQNGCVDTSACVVVTTVGVDENIFAETIKIYPNPNNGQFTIELAENSLVEITDILGKQVFKSNLQKGSNQLSLSHIETGVYFVTIITGGKHVSVKIVKE